MTRKSVSCDCGFEMSKSYEGHPDGMAKEEYEAISLPDECPVCGADLTP
jgi:hypothetical protein